MKTKIQLLIAALFCAGMVSAQVNLGTIKGVAFDSTANATIPNAKVFLEGGGNEFKALADLDGKFEFEALKPGIYQMTLVAMGKDTTRLTAIEVNPDHITDLGNIRLREGGKMLKAFVYEYKPPMIEKDIAKIQIKLEDIAHSPNIQNPKELFASMNSDINIVEGTSDVIIRGSRPGDVIYYIDGVKVNDLNGVPGVAIGSMTGYTGGVPAKYGDTTGGVIVLETKSYFDLYYAWKARQ